MTLPKPYYQDDHVTIYNGDCVTVMQTMPDNSVDSIVTDPPYGLSFMGKVWDSTVPGVEVWEQCLRILKPGGHLLAFAGTRTQHRMACAIEDAGFEIRDMIAWVYGSGFSKGFNLKREPLCNCIGEGNPLPPEPRGQQTGQPAGVFESSGTLDDGTLCGRGQCSRCGKLKAEYEGWSTSLKPSLEPITMARKPLIGTVAANVMQYGTGGINVDACRVEATGEKLNGGASDGSSVNKVHEGWDRPWKNDPEKQREARERANANQAKAEQLGRWPANLIHSGCDEVLALFPDVGQTSQPGKVFKKSSSKGKNGNTGEAYGAESRAEGEPMVAYGDSGSAARFFQTCEFSENEWLFCRAKAILETWNQNLANTADNCTNLSSEHVVSALSDVVTLVSLGRLGLSVRSGHFTNATPKELRRLCESLTVTMLSIESDVSRELPQERHIQNGCLVRSADTPKQTGITTITISHWKSDGCADDVTLSITQPNMVRGEAGSVSRLQYTPKADSAERRKSKHPTVKPLDLIRYLVRMVTPIGGVVLDPFLGSGTLCEASALEHSRSIGIELDEAYCDDAVQRIRQRVLKYMD